MDLESKMKGKKIETCLFLSHHHKNHIGYDFMMMVVHVGWGECHESVL